MNLEEKNNGVLLLIVSGENKTFIATDSGFKKCLNDFTRHIALWKKKFTTSPSIYNNKYNLSYVVPKLATNINTIDKKNDINTSKKSSGDSLIPQRSQFVWVTDNADVLSYSDIKYVISQNEKFAETSNAEISVLTI